MRLGLVTIGQVPRTDLTADVADLLAGVDWVEHGALDALDDGALQAIRPRPHEGTLISRLRDGSSVTIALERIGPLLDDALRACAQDGCTQVLVLCTGHLDHGPAPLPVAHAEELAHASMAGIADDRPLGVICPLPAQQADIAGRWATRLGRPVLVADADPYSTSSRRAVADAAAGLAAEGAQVLFLDCMGYTRAHAQAATDATGLAAYPARALAIAALTGASA